MSSLIGHLSLASMAAFFLLLIVIEVLLRKVYRRAYTGSEKRAFAKKIAWLVENRSSLSRSDALAVHRIVVMRRFLLGVAILMLVLYVLGNAVGE